MFRGFGHGLITTLAIALVYGVLYAVIELTWGLLLVALFGGWLIGGAIRRGVSVALLRRHPEPSGPEGGAIDPTWPRGTPAMGTLLGLVAWIAGTYVAFAIIQLVEGAGPLLERLSPGNFAAFLNAIAGEPGQQVLQAAILAAFVVVAAYAARAPAPKLAPDKRR